MNNKAVLAVVFVFVGCGSNMVFLELLVKNDPGIGNLVTFLQFLFISIHGLIFVSKFGSQRPQIGLKDYCVLVAMFFLVNVCNNMAFDYNIPVPLHMIFRAGSLIANMVMGVIILKKRYTVLKYLSVLMITLGIVICTVISSQEKKVCTDCEGALPSKEVEEHFFWWVLGISLLTFALFLSARMGIYQEWLYRVYGKHPDEALFYTHLLPLPGFLFLYQNIAEHASLAGQSVPLAATFGLPSTWVYLIGNVLTQYMCIRSVYVLTTETSSLTVTLVLTLRKFCSLLFSIVYFKNPFTLAHWLGTALVFAGTLIFTEVPQMLVRTTAKKKLS